MKTLFYWLTYSSLSLFRVAFFGCKKKQEGFLDKLDVGKYEITQYKEYPNGSKDTLIYEAYGPWNQKAGQRYYFDIHDTSIYYRSWELTKSRTTFLSYNTYINDSRTYNSEIISVTNDEVKVEFTYYSNSQGTVSDSATGVITFKRIPQ
jgi:hypothetical protein